MEEEDIRITPPATLILASQKSSRVTFVSRVKDSQEKQVCMVGQSLDTSAPRRQNTLQITWSQCWKKFSKIDNFFSAKNPWILNFTIRVKNQNDYLEFLKNWKNSIFEFSRPKKCSLFLLFRIFTVKIGFFKKKFIFQCLLKNETIHGISDNHAELFMSRSDWNFCPLVFFVYTTRYSNNSMAHSVSFYFFFCLLPCVVNFFWLRSCHFHKSYTKIRKSVRVFQW